MVVMSAGTTPRGRSQSLFAPWTQSTRASGNPQKRAESPRTNRPSELSNSGLGPGSGTRLASNGEVGVFFDTTLIFIEQAHSFGRLKFIRFVRLRDLRLPLALQLKFIVSHGAEGLHDRRPFDDLFDV